MKQKHIQNTLQKFDTISLDELNSSMRLLNRVETKYLVSKQTLSEILHHMLEDYRILTIGEYRSFAYDNVYMDTEDHFFYNQHQGGSHFRTKIRTRKYVESELYFFEFKQRDKKEIQKYRYATASNEHGVMNEHGKEFFEGMFHSLYGHEFSGSIGPSLRNQYKRITLCNKHSAERLTIDFDISYFDPQSDHYSLKNTHPDHQLTNTVIIESKSETGECQSKNILESLGIAAADACSKYCMGLYFLSKVDHYSHFLPSLTTIATFEQMETVSEAPKTVQAPNHIDIPVEVLPAISTVSTS